MTIDHDGFERDQELAVDGPTSFPVDRRDFVKLTATGLLVLLAIDRESVAGQETARLPMGRQGYPNDIDAYLHVGADGRVTCMVGKIEQGQGIMTSLPQLLAALRRRFAHAFEFEAQVDAGTASATLTFPACAMHKVVASQGEVAGTANLCELFHEYFAGLMSAFTGKSYAATTQNAVGQCTVKFQIRS